MCLADSSKGIPSSASRSTRYPSDPVPRGTTSQVADTREATLQHPRSAVRQTALRRDPFVPVVTMMWPPLRWRQWAEESILMPIGREGRTRPWGSFRLSLRRVLRATGGGAPVPARRASHRRRCLLARACCNRRPVCEAGQCEVRAARVGRGRSGGTAFRPSPLQPWRGSRVCTTAIRRGCRIPSRAPSTNPI
jgi:hypothetical protein